MEFMVFFKKYVEPFLAVGIFVMLGLTCYLLSQEHKLKNEISENCGWEEEDYKCYCEKSDVDEIEYTIKYASALPEGLLDNVSMD